MFGELIEKAKLLVAAVIPAMEKRARNRARYQAASAILGGIIASSGFEGLGQVKTKEDTEAFFINTSLALAEAIEAKIYATKEDPIVLNF